MTDTEKITINLSPVDMGQIDLLVQEGFYSNRTDFIRSAIRNQLNTHGDTIKQVMVRKSMAFGVISYSRSDLEKALAKGEKLNIKLVGVAFFHNDITPELAREAIQNLEVHGVLHASEAFKQALADRMT